jgi:hypothetical protein
MRRVRRDKRKKLDKSYYVYALCYPNGTPFYIGKGKGKRAWRHLTWDKRNPLKKNIINKIEASGKEVLVDIVEKGLPEYKAFRKEIFLIAKYGRRGDGSGILANATSGGEGISGIVFSDKHRVSIGIASKAIMSNSDIRERISRANKKYWSNPECRKKHTKALADSWTDERRKANNRLRKRLYREKGKEIGKKVGESLREGYKQGRIKPPAAKLSSNDLLAIRLGYALGGKKATHLANIYPVSKGTIYAILRGSIWPYCPLSSCLIDLCTKKLEIGRTSGRPR